jgi:hypothetical protein
MYKKLERMDQRIVRAKQQKVTAEAAAAAAAAAARITDAKEEGTENAAAGGGENPEVKPSVAESSGECSHPGHFIHGSVADFYF